MLVSQKYKQVILKLNNPGKVLGVVPGAKASKKYQGIVYVPHNPDTTAILRNIGFKKTPSPVTYEYDWPGRYSPYKHQMVTVNFLTGHRRAFVLSGLGCVDKDTEYMSPSGWKKISEYSGGDVLQYNRGTGKAEFVTPLAFIKKPCSEFIRAKTKYGIDQMLSEEHRVLLETAKGKQEVLTAAEWEQRQNDWVSGVKKPRSFSSIGYSHGGIPNTFSFSGVGFPLSDQRLRVQIAVIADGYFPSATNRCVVRIKKDRKKDRLRKLLTDAGIPWTERTKDYPTAVGFTVFVFYAPRREKEFTPDWYACTGEQLAIFCDEVIHWDGSCASHTKNKNRGVGFSTYVKASADFVQFAFCSTGRTARLYQRVRERRGKVEIEYAVGVRNEGKPLLISARTSGSVKISNLTRVPSEDGYKYCFSVPSGFLVLRRNGCVFLTGNSGKTNSALWAADYLMGQKLVNKCLIISPLSTLERVWGDAIFTDLFHRKFAVLHGSAARRKKLFADAKFDFYIINPDGFPIIAEEYKKREDINLVIADEATYWKDPSTNRFRLFKSCFDANPPDFLWMMTATPTPNAPYEAWGMAKLMGTNQGTTFSRFKEATMQKIGPFKWVPRSNCEALVHSLLSPAVRFKTEDCIDLPPCTHHTRQCELTDNQRKMLSELKRTFAVEAHGGVISAVNEADKQNKMLQLILGFLYGTDDDGERETIRLEFAPRLKLLKEVIEEVGGNKVIIFVPYVELTSILKEHLSTTHSVEIVDGSVSSNKRNAIFKAFQESPEPQILVAHPKTMSHGLTLTSSACIVWYAPFPSNEIYEQANGRINRPSQTRTTNIFHLEATELERTIYQRLKTRQKLQGSLLDYIHRQEM